MAANGEKELTTIFRTDSSVDAGMVRGYLESHEITVVLSPDQEVPLLRGGPRPIKVQVAQKDAEVAIKLLQSVDFKNTPTRAARVAKILSIGLGILLLAFVIFVILKDTLR